MWKKQNKKVNIRFNNNNAEKDELRGQKVKKENVHLLSVRGGISIIILSISFKTLA